jgi:hypothetical protein
LASRRIAAILPVFLIALLAQVFAPAGASLAMARASNASLAAPICQTSGDRDGRNHTPGAPASHDDCCSLCQFAHSGAAPLPPQAVLIITQPNPAQRVEWILRADRLTHRAQRAHAQARAPPFFS